MGAQAANPCSPQSEQFPLFAPVSDAQAVARNCALTRGQS
jgi:hypothetical protein